LKAILVDHLPEVVVGKWKVDASIGRCTARSDDSAFMVLWLGVLRRGNRRGNDNSQN
jgi:hypothetical protein